MSLDGGIPRLALKREGGDSELARDLGDADDLRGSGLRIRCPRCAWQPRPEDRWGCHCGTVWNTFDTRGVCPGCSHAWEQTQCLRCGAWSRHDDWYVAGDEGQRT